MTNAVIDFESYYDKEISVSTLGNEQYSKRTDAYILSTVVNGEGRCGTIPEMAEYCASLAADPTVRPVAANANFDQTWWEKYFPRFSQGWHCVLDQGVVAQNPRGLPGLAKNILGISVDKSVRSDMKGVDYFQLPADRQEFIQRYCLNDSIVEAEILEKCPQMSSTEAAIAAHTRMMNRRGILINSTLVYADKTKLELMRFEAFQAIPWHAHSKTLSYAALKRWCGHQGIPVPKSTAKTDEECADLMSDHPALNEVLGQMRRFRRANTMLKKIESLKGRLGEDDILHTDMLYCGAPHTRRWSCKGFNVQNLDKEPLIVTDEGRRLFEELMLLPQSPDRDERVKAVQAVHGVWTRNWIIPRPGHVFLVLDYAQIEPRCLNWLCGNEPMMAALREGFSYYESYARAAKGWKGAAGTIKKELGKEKYTKLKNECLGCGYGMGPAKYVSYAHVTEAEAKIIVTGFRAANPKVTQFWRKLDNLIQSAVRDKSKHLQLEMPTGETLNHYHLRSTPKGFASFTIRNDFTHSSMQAKLWGGVLTENLCQRMSRDLIAEGILALEAAGLPVVFHVHDEVILEVPEDSKHEAKAEAEQIMQKAPDWCPDLPLGVEGDFCYAYTK